jgi:hypothetical protein
MHPTLIVWWRYGKEHGEEAFRVNSLEIIAAHIDAQAARFRQTPETEWRWQPVDDDLIVERARAACRELGW